MKITALSNHKPGILTNYIGINNLTPCTIYLISLMLLKFLFSGGSLYSKISQQEKLFPEEVIVYACIEILLSTLQPTYKCGCTSYD